MIKLYLVSVLTIEGSPTTKKRKPKMSISWLGLIGFFGFIWILGIFIKM